MSLPINVWGASSPTACWCARWRAFTSWRVNWLFIRRSASIAWLAWMNDWRHLRLEIQESRRLQRSTRMVERRWKMHLAFLDEMGEGAFLLRPAAAGLRRGRGALRSFGHLISDF